MAPRDRLTAAALSLLSLLVLASACSGGDDAPAGPAEQCGDALDNDSDGAIDCADPDCAGSTCRQAQGACDEPEACTAGACPEDALSAGGMFSGPRAAADVCDAEELCDGSSAACPEDVVMPAGTPCRDAADLCDVEEACDGSAKTCPQDVVAASGVECRPAAGGCDVPEACDGLEIACPQDEVLPAATVCRPMAGGCDFVPEACDGLSAACPNDAGNCLPTQYCDGASCLPKKASGTACGGGAECQSGYCVDGYCCNSACAGTCQACNVRFREGNCEVLVSEDPANECGRFLCNGSSCYGYCVTGAAGGECGSRYCDSGSYCKDQRCVAKLLGGSFCTAGCQCASGTCFPFICW